MFWLRLIVIFFSPSTEQCGVKVNPVDLFSGSSRLLEWDIIVVSLSLHSRQPFKQATTTSLQILSYSPFTVIFPSRWTLCKFRISSSVLSQSQSLQEVSGPVAQNGRRPVTCYPPARLCGTNQLTSCCRSA